MPYCSTTHSAASLSNYILFFSFALPQSAQIPQNGNEPFLTGRTCPKHEAFLLFEIVHLITTRHTSIIMCKWHTWWHHNCISTQGEVLRYTSFNMLPHFIFNISLHHFCLYMVTVLCYIIVAPLCVMHFLVQVSTYYPSWVFLVLAVKLLQLGCHQLFGRREHDPQLQWTG